MKRKVIIRILEILGITALVAAGILTVERDTRGVSRNITFPNTYYYKIGVGEEVKLTYDVRAWTGKTTAEFTSTDKSIVSVSQDGTVTGLKPGLAGVEVYVTYKDKKDEPVSNILLFDVRETETEEQIAAKEAEARKIRPAKNDYFDVSYETESYCEIGEKIKLNAAYVKKDGTRLTDITWQSENTSIATVNSEGYVKGKKSGTTVIIAKCESENKYFEFTVTVLPRNMSGALKEVVSGHNSNVKTVYNLGIGDGTPSYYYDFCGSVNNLLFDGLTIDRTYYDKLPLWVKNDGVMPAIEYITVHYTGNMAKTADADNNADYFNYEGYSASIHFVTGRHNLTGSWSKDNYVAFAVMNETYAGWHASGYGYGEHKWYNTGVKYSYNDPETPVISVSSRSYFTINGHETSVAIPESPYALYVEGPSYDYSGVTVKTFNDQGIAWKVENGVYYIGNTYWNPSYQTMLSNIGGNFCSIGIESCVDEGSDLNHTWHVTAQLCAQLMKKYDLDISRVVGHHFFAGKDCPQPLLENDKELWNMFIEYVQAEYDMITKFKNASVKMYVEDGGSGNLDSLGLCYQDGEAHCVTYKVTVKDGLSTKTITLASIVESKYKNNSTSSHKSIQELGEDII